MQLHIWLVAALVVALLLLSTAAHAQSRALGVEAAPPANEPRIALVVGNADYDVGRLLNPVNDARAMAQVLRELGFKVTLVEDANRRRLKQAIDDFGAALSKGGWGLFYYSGHGIQHDGLNYLIPVHASIGGPSEIEFEAIPADLVLAKMKDAQSLLNVLILDACRNNPYVTRFKALSRGLAVVQAPDTQNTLIAYATSPGEVADDGTGPNSPYTGALVQHIATAGLKLLDVFTRVNADVQRATDGRQRPWQSASLTRDFYFRYGPPPPVIEPPRGLGHLLVAVNARGTKVTINGELHGMAYPNEPLKLSNLPVGAVDVQLQAEGYQPATRRAEIRENEWTPVQVALVPLPPPPPVPAVTAAGAAAGGPGLLAYGGIGLSGGLGIFAVVKYLEAVDLHSQAEDAARTDPDKSRRLQDERDQAAQTALIAAALGGVLLWVTRANMDDGGLYANQGPEWQLKPMLVSPDGNLGPGVLVHYGW